MSGRYKLTTIKDIFDQVPVDRIQGCMNELADGMIQAKEFGEAMKLIATEVECEWPEFITWVDDKKGVVKMTPILEPR